MTDRERYEAGRRVLATMLGDTAADQSAERMRALHPEFERLVMAHVMHDLYGREGLDLKTRLLCTIAALTVLGRREQLAVHGRPGPRLRSHDGRDRRGDVADERLRRIPRGLGCPVRAPRKPGRHGACGIDRPVVAGRGGADPDLAASGVGVPARSRLCRRRSPPAGSGASGGRGIRLHGQADRADSSEAMAGATLGCSSDAC